MPHTVTAVRKGTLGGRQWLQGSSHRAGPWLLLVSLLLAGCVSYRVDRAAKLNTGICYLPWEDRALCAAPQYVANEVAIPPGMKVIVVNAPIYKFGDNVLAPPLAVYEWIRPQQDGSGHVKYGQEDFFFFSYILSAGIPTVPTPSRFDPSQTLVDFGQPLKDPGFYDQLADKALAPAFATLRLTSTNSGPRWADCGKPPNQGKDCTAALVRRWLAEPAKDDMSNPVNQQALTIEVASPSGGATTTYSVFDWSSGFFHEHPKNLVGAERNGWYGAKTDVFTSRAHLELEIPVRFHGELSSRYVPVYWSVADLEKRFNVIVRGLRRSGEYLGPLPMQGHRFCKQRGHIDRSCFLAGDGYFTLSFGDFGQYFGSRGSLTAAGRLKPDLLLAPGDVVLLEPGPAATDLPGSR